MTAVGGESQLPALAAASMLLTSSESSAPSLEGAHAALTLVQQLAASVAAPARVLLVTCGVVGMSASGDHGASDASKGGVWGLSRVLRLEHASMGARNVDVSRAGVMATLDLSVAATEAEMTWNRRSAYGPSAPRVWSGSDFDCS